MWSYDANVSFMARSNLSDATLEKMRAAATREQLNGMYIKNGTLMVLDGGQVKLAHKVSQVGGKQAPAYGHQTGWQPAVCACQGPVSHHQPL